MAKAIAMIEGTKKITDYLKFCLIRTGNENDAYTLFEVLNDRALEVDDLDLIKNLFYRRYCLSNQVPSDTKKLDKQIEELENIWGEETFTQELSDKQTKLIAYLSFLFLTGNENIDYTDKQRYRDIAEDYLNKKTKLTYDNIKNDFKIFQAVRIMIQNVFNLQYRSTKKKSLEAEMNQKVSITFKAMHLINALGYKGVMPALTNIILKTYFESLANVNQSKLDIDDFTAYVKALITDSDHTDNRFSHIHDCACNIWKLSLLTYDYKISREYAKQIVSRINYKNNDLQCIGIGIKIFDKAREQFKDWTNSWRYRANQNSDFKVTLLLSKLIQSDKDDANNKLCFPFSQRTFNTDKIELEHLEASKMNNIYGGDYFVPKDPKVDRKDYVDALGNFMVMDDENNKRKSDSPAYTATDHYKKMGLQGHWLIIEFEELMQKYGEKSNKNSSYYIPTENFFDKRKEYLQKYFYSILRYKTVNTDDVDIVNSI